MQACHPQQAHYGAHVPSANHDCSARYSSPSPWPPMPQQHQYLPRPQASSMYAPFEPQGGAYLPAQQHMHHSSRAIVSSMPPACQSLQQMYAHQQQQVLAQQQQAYARGQLTAAGLSGAHGAGGGYISSGSGSGDSSIYSQIYGAWRQKEPHVQQLPATYTQAVRGVPMSAAPACWLSTAEDEDDVFSLMLVDGDLDM